jgi:hypothetical protein
MIAPNFQLNNSMAGVTPLPPILYRKLQDLLRCTIIRANAGMVPTLAMDASLSGTPERCLSISGMTSLRHDAHPQTTHLAHLGHVAVSPTTKAGGTNVEQVGLLQ